MGVRLILHQFPGIRLIVQASRHRVGLILDIPGIPEMRSIHLGEEGIPPRLKEYFPT